MTLWKWLGTNVPLNKSICDCGFFWGVGGVPVQGVFFWGGDVQYKETVLCLCTLISWYCEEGLALSSGIPCRDVDNDAPNLIVNADTTFCSI